MSDQKKQALPTVGEGYEVSDANPGFLLKFGLSLLILTGAALALMFALLSWFDSTKAQAENEPHQLATESQMPSGLRLQVAPEHDYAAFAASQDSILHSYGWVQQQAGVVRIPIDSAMGLLLRRGLPARVDSDSQ